MPEASTPASAPAAAPAAAGANSAPAATESQGNPGGSAAGSAAAAKPNGAAPKPELYELKVDGGKVLKLTKEQLLAEASKGHVADKRFQEAAQLRKQNEALVNKFRNPKQAIEALLDPALGLSKEQVREAMEEWYQREFIDPEKLTPEQKKLREAEDRIKRYEDAERTRDEEKQRSETESMTTRAREELQGQLIEAIEKGGLPKTNDTLRKLARWIRINQTNGFNAPTEVLIAQVRKEQDAELRDRVQVSDGEALIRLLGEDVIQKLRKYDLEQLRKLRSGGGAPAPAEGAGDPAPAENKTGRAPTSAEVNERIRQLQRTGRY